MEVAARRLGVPASTFRTWLDGDHLPKVSIFEHWQGLSELLGLSESDLLRAAGLLPDSFASSLLVAQTTREIRAELEHAGQILREAKSLTQSSAAAQVVNELTTSEVNWEIRLRSARRGNEIPIVYHHYVGLVPPEQLADWSDTQLRTYVRRDLLADVWQPLSLYWRLTQAHDWPTAPALLIQVPEQEASRTAVGRSPRPDGPPVLVLSLPWGYGELLGSLVADAIGFGNIDFRYFGIPEDRQDKTALVQRELDHISPGFVAAVPPLMLLEDLDIGGGQLVGSLPILMTYGDRMRDRASRVYRDPLVRLAHTPLEGIATVERRLRTALKALPTGSEYIEVILSDDDVVVDGNPRSDRVNDTIAWLALSVATTILGRWGAARQPVAGPLRQLIRPSGIPRTPPPMASQVLVRTVD